MTKGFFDSIRPALFRGKMSQSQVDGMLDIINATSNVPINHRAYILATAYHETGAKMQPTEESLNYSVEGLLSTFGRHRISEADARKYGRARGRAANQEAIANIIYGGKWGRDNLGNVKQGDGWRYRGRGLVQVTGRANYTKHGFADNPNKAMHKATSVKMLSDGLLQGRYTGRKLADFNDYVSMRQAVNGSDKATVIADYATAFETALRLIEGQPESRRSLFSLVWGLLFK